MHIYINYIPTQATRTVSIAVPSPSPSLSLSVRECAIMYINGTPEFIPHHPKSPRTPLSTDTSFSVFESEQLTHTVHTSTSMNSPPRMAAGHLLQAIQFCRNDYANLAHENQYLHAQLRQQNVEFRTLRNAYHSLHMRYVALSGESPSSSLMFDRRSGTEVWQRRCTSR